MFACGAHLDESKERELYIYYGLDYAGQRSDSGIPSGQATSIQAGRGTQAKRVSAGHDTSGRNTGDATTRSKEQVHAGTEMVTAGTARLRKWVETEDVYVKVPVAKEQARLVTEPITDANRVSGLAGPAIAEDEHEVTLTEERPAVAKESVAGARQLTSCAQRWHAAACVGSNATSGKMRQPLIVAPHNAAGAVARPDAGTANTVATACRTPHGSSRGPAAGRPGAGSCTISRWLAATTAYMTDPSPSHPAERCIGSARCLELSCHAVIDQLRGQPVPETPCRTCPR